MILLMELWEVVEVVVVGVVRGVVFKGGHGVRNHATCEGTHWGDVVGVVGVEGIHDWLLLMVAGS